MRTKIETERTHLFDVGIQIAMRIRISGRVTEAELRSSFEYAVEAHGVLGTHIILDGSGEAFYEENDGAFYEERKGNQNGFFMEETPWEDILRREERNRFRIEEGEYLRAFCYQLDQEGCEILFLMHHLGGDGKSLVYFIETFMRSLSGEELTFREIRTIPSEEMDRKELLKKLGPAALIPGIYNGKWKKDPSKKVFLFSDLDEAYDSFWETRESKVSEYRISPEMQSKILTRCKAWDVRFTAYLITAFLRRSGRKMDIGLAADARTDHNRCMGNQATGISVQYTYRKKLSFRENVVRVQNLMDEKLEDEDKRMFFLPFIAAFDPTLLDALLLEHAGTFHSKTSGRLAKLMGYVKKKDLSVTNLTELDIPVSYGKYRIEYFSFVPPVIATAKNVIGVSTLGDCTIMTVHRMLNKISE